MDYRTYQKLRAYCWQELSVYIDTPERNEMRDTFIKLAGGTIGQIKHEGQVAHEIYQCSDLTPRENAAAELLAVISNHRAITWQREPSPPNGRAPAPPLDASTADKLANATRAAVSGYAAFLPEPERAVLLAYCQTMPAQGAATAAIARPDDKSAATWLLVEPKRSPGYRWAIFTTLKDERTAGRPCPQPRQVLDAWRAAPPSDANGNKIEVMSDGIKYTDASGVNFKTADLKAIKQVIKSLTTVQAPGKRRASAT